MNSTLLCLCLLLPGPGVFVEICVAAASLQVLLWCQDLPHESCSVSVKEARGCEKLIKDTFKVVLQTVMFVTKGWDDQNKGSQPWLGCKETNCLYLPVSNKKRPWFRLHAVPPAARFVAGWVVRAPALAAGAAWLWRRPAGSPLLPEGGEALLCISPCQLVSSASTAHWLGWPSDRNRKKTWKLFTFFVFVMLKEGRKTGNCYLYTLDHRISHSIYCDTFKYNFILER